MIPSAVFARYARALADVTLEKNEDAAVLKDLSTYREIFRQVPALLDALDSPAIPRESKENVLSELLVRYPVIQSTSNFLRILLRHHRIRYFEDICDLYQRTLNERRGIIAARVTSAVPLSEEDVSALRTSLAGATGRQSVLTMQTDPELLAGVVVQIGSTVYDGSIRTQLDEMRRRLMQE
jgi:F-type H+-transporting ATPase subunit delta